MKVIRHTDKNFTAQLRELSAASSLFDVEIEARTRAILHDVLVRGDAALLELTERFDGAKLSVEQLAVTQAELFNASLAADESLRAAVAEAEKNIAGFAKKSLRKNWQSKNSHGASVGEKFDPFKRVGVYIPGGTAPLVSTALMTITLAKVAGCQEIVVTHAVRQGWLINPRYSVRGARGGRDGNLSCGRRAGDCRAGLRHHNIRRVQKIFGPGNAYVSTAKRLLVGHVAIDLLAGPSDVLDSRRRNGESRICRRRSARAGRTRFRPRTHLARDDFGKILKAVENEIARQLPKLARREFIQRALKTTAG